MREDILEVLKRLDPLQFGEIGTLLGFRTLNDFIELQRELDLMRADGSVGFYIDRGVPLYTHKEK